MATGTTTKREKMASLPRDRAPTSPLGPCASDVADLEVPGQAVGPGVVGEVEDAGGGAQVQV